jgi:hypothetical protein
MSFYKNNALVRQIPDPTNLYGSKLQSNGTTTSGVGNYFWMYPGSGNTGTSTPDNSAWLYRSIYTHGYLAGGYKGYNPWRAVNKMWHATEVTLYCGEQLHAVASYTKGIWSDYNAYIVAHGNPATYSQTASQLASYSLFNGSMRMSSGDGYSSSGISYGYEGNDPKNEGLSYGTAGYGSHVGGMALSVARSDNGGANDIKGQSGWIVGGGSSTVNRMHFPSEVMYAGWDSGYSGICDGASGELRGWFVWTNEYKYVTWSNATWTTGWGTGGGWTRGDYQNKVMSSKYGWHYVGTSSNATLPKARFSDSTGATLASFNKIRAYGEDNCMMGQDNGYVMGHYDGQQNNHTIRQSYSTDSEVTLGAAAMPKGHYGQSSGACSTAAMTICANSPVSF